MTLEEKILYELATKTVLPKDVLIRLVKYPDRETAGDDPDGKTTGRDRSVQNAIRKMKAYGLISEVSTAVKRTGKKPLKVDLLSITKEGVACLRAFGYPAVLWARYLSAEDVSVIVGSGNTARAIATRYIRGSAAAMMADGIGARECTLFLTNDRAKIEHSSGSISLERAVTDAMDAYDRGLDYEIEDEVRESREDIVFVPALTMKRELAEKNGPSSDNDKQSGQCAGIFLAGNKPYLVYTSFLHSILSWDSWLLKKDNALLTAYGRDFCNLRPETMSRPPAVLLVSDAAAFRETYGNMAGQIKRKRSGQRLVSETLTVSEEFFGLYVVPMEHEGKIELRRILQGPDILMEESEYLIRKLLGVFHDVRQVKSAGRFITPRSVLFNEKRGSYIAIRPHLNVSELRQLRSFRDRLPDKPFTILCRRCLVPYFRVVAGDMQIEPLEPFLERYDLLQEYRETWYSFVPVMQAEREEQIHREYEADKAALTSLIRRKKKKAPGENKTDKDAPTIISLTSGKYIDFDEDEPPG